MTIEALINSCKNEEELSLKAERISKMLARSAFTVQKVVKIRNLLNQSLFTGESIEKYTDFISDLILTYAPEEYHQEIIDRLSEASPLLKNANQVQDQTAIGTN
jgi:hypothetical protein